MLIYDTERWLEVNEPDTFEEGHDLYMATSGQSCGVYDAKTEGARVFISRDGAEETLVLASEKAVSEFQKRIERYNPHKEMSWDAAMAFVSAMRKDD